MTEILEQRRSAIDSNYRINSCTASSFGNFVPASISWTNVNVWSKQKQSLVDQMMLRTAPHGTQIIKNGRFEVINRQFLNF